MEAPTEMVNTMMVSIIEQVSNCSYPIVTLMYAVTYEENTNENIDEMLGWILSEEGQYIIEESGYVSVLD